MIGGSEFSLVFGSQGSVRIYTDTLSLHKVYYWRQGGYIYATNDADWVRIIIEPVYRQTTLLAKKLIGGIIGELGYETIYDGVSVLPESSILEMTSHGHEISSYRSISDLVSPAASWGESFEALVAQLHGDGKNLSANAMPLIPISGGFDSRVCASMFYPFNRLSQRVRSYTYNREPGLDIPIGRGIARSIGSKHYDLALGVKSDSAVIKQWRESGAKTDIFDYVFGVRLEPLITSDTVMINGNGGDTDWAYKYSALKSISCAEAPEEIVERFLWSNIPEYLKVDVRREIFEIAKHQLLSKYECILDDQDFHTKFGSAIFHLERYRNQTKRQSTRKYGVYSPFGNPEFIGVVFAGTRRNLIRSSKQSIHRNLVYELARRALIRIPFIKRNQWSLSTRVTGPVLETWSRLSWKANHGDTNTRLRALQYDVVPSPSDAEVLLSFSSDDVFRCLIGPLNGPGTQSRVNSTLERKVANYLRFKHGL